MALQLRPALSINGTPGILKDSQAILSNAQPFSSLGSSVINNCSARLGFHAQAKAMGSFPFDVAGLKCSLHNFFLKRSFFSNYM